jgi:hypothetical protein
LQPDTDADGAHLRQDQKENSVGLEASGNSCVSEQVADLPVPVDSALPEIKTELPRATSAVSESFPQEIPTAEPEESDTALRENPPEPPQTTAVQSETIPHALSAAHPASDDALQEIQSEAAEPEASHCSKQYERHCKKLQKIYGAEACKGGKSPAKQVPEQSDAAGITRPAPHSKEVWPIFFLEGGVQPATRVGGVQPATQVVSSRAQPVRSRSRNPIKRCQYNGKTRLGCSRKIFPTSS